MLVIFEGIDGVGKTTVANEYRKLLHDRGHSAMMRHWGAPEDYRDFWRTALEAIIEADAYEGITIWDRGFASMDVYSRTRHRMHSTTLVASGLHTMVNQMMTCRMVLLERDVETCHENDPEWDLGLLAAEHEHFVRYAFARPVWRIDIKDESAHEIAQTIYERFNT